MKTKNSSSGSRITVPASGPSARRTSLGAPASSAASAGSTISTQTSRKAGGPQVLQLLLWLEEDREIFKGYLIYSSSWSKIAKNLVGRTENSVKNRFYSTVRKLLADQEKSGLSLKVELDVTLSNSKPKGRTVPQRCRTS